MAYLLKFVPDFGSEYTFPSTFYPADRSLANQVPSEPLVRANGARVLRGYTGARRLVIRGGLVGPNEPLGGVTDFQGEIDDLLAALTSGQGDLYFGEDDFRFRCCQFENFGQVYEPTFWDRILTGVEIPFVTGDPYRYAVGADGSDTWTSPSSGDTRTVTATGREPAAPTLSIEVGGTGPQAIAFTITNTTTGESLTIAGTVTGGDVIVVDSLTPKSVKIGSVDKRLLFEGQFLTLKPGANVLQVSWAGGSIASVLTEWIPRKR